MTTRHLLRSTAIAACLVGAVSAANALEFTVVGPTATFVISTRADPATGLDGFLDATPVAPVGGNTGTTLGAQRVNVYKYVAGIWAANVASTVPITVSAGWESLQCDATSAVLGSAGAWNIWHDFPNSRAGTWYPAALANKLSGVNLTAGQPDDGTGFGNVDIKSQFNVNLGNTGCLTGTPFYLGLDGNAGSQVNFVETLLHEIGHGLGFSVLTVQTSTGRRLNSQGTAFVDTGGLPSIWEPFVFDNTRAKTWLDMTSAERQASAINPLNVAWIGPNAVAGAAVTLQAVPSLVVSTSVPGAAGFYDYNTAAFGPPVQNPSNFGVLANAGLGCDPFDAATAAAVNGKVAVMDRGTCSFVIKVKNAQNAGATGAIIVNNAAGGAPGLGGSDPTITIPTVSVRQDQGTVLKAAITAAPLYGTRGRPGTVSARFGADASRIAGADPLKRPLLYTPNPLIGGSSVSHWDVSAFPNLLMEPNISPDLTTTLVPPLDLTLPLLKDIGW